MPNLESHLFKKIAEFIQGDLRKLASTYDIYQNNNKKLEFEIMNNLFKSRKYNEDTKFIVKKILTNYFPSNQHNYLMNETERTSVALLIHENLIDLLENIPKRKTIPFYLDVLENISFADYIDRITFQKQIWTLNELSSLIKTFYNHYLYHMKFKYKDEKANIKVEDIRFTKILTKYSTEYNNILFIDSLCSQLFLDKRDMLSYFVDLTQKFSIDEIYTLFFDKSYEISKLDIQRLIKYLKYYTIGEKVNSL